MNAPILTMKLRAPRIRPKSVSRPRLTDRLNEGLHGKLVLVSAPAGFGKSTLISQCLAECDLPTAWLSLDEADSDPITFLTYFIAAIQTIDTNVGGSLLGALQSPQRPPSQMVLKALLNEIAALPDDFVFVADDYQMIEKPSEHPLAFLVEHQPPQMRLVIATREDPPLPLARLRARGELTELRAADLRFTYSEAADFLNEVMGLSLTAENVAALEARTEGWIAGLQLAAISMQGHPDAASFIESFTGSHRYVLDYLLEEVLKKQPESVQRFLLRTSILKRMCGPLCDAVLLDSSNSGQHTLESIEGSNLFVVPLDNERRWYRYHHLFADLLRQRLQQATRVAGHSQGIEELHVRASIWFEENDFYTEAFRHAAAANDVVRAARLIEGRGMPLHFQGGVAPVLNWLESLPAEDLNAMPALWVWYASALSVAGQNTKVEQALQAAKEILKNRESNRTNRNLIGHVAAIRAQLAAPRYDAKTVAAQSRRALEHLDPENLPIRTVAHWTMGFAHQLEGERAAAGQAYLEAISASRATGNVYIEILATTCLGIIQEADIDLQRAAESYRRAQQLVGDPPWPTACEAYLGLARIMYEWNDIDAARSHAEQSLHLAGQIENIDNSVGCEMVLARVRLANGDIDGASAMLAEAERSALRNGFSQQVPEIVSAQVRCMLRKGNLKSAAHLAETHQLPLSRARVHLAQGDPSAALEAIRDRRQGEEPIKWVDNRLETLLLRALARRALNEMGKAIQLLSDALMLAEPSGFIRTFADEGAPMAKLLSEAAAQGIAPTYIDTLLRAFVGEDSITPAPSGPTLPEPLSRRELEILSLIAQGLSNRAIAQKLFLALSTIKGHNRNIFGKLQVESRTEAVARARTLGLL